MNRVQSHNYIDYSKYISENTEVDLDNKEEDTKWLLISLIINSKLSKLLKNESQTDQTAWESLPLLSLWCDGPLMFGKTPPSAMVVFANSLFNSSSFLMAKRICLGTILVFLLSFAAFPASSRT